LPRKPKFSLTDAMALQNDATSPMARRSVALLKGLAGRNDDERAALALLAGWDGHMGPDSGAAALHEIWASRHLPVAAVKAIVPEQARRTFGRTSIGNILPVLEDGKLLGTDPQATRAAILLGSLGAAFDEAKRLLGPDPAAMALGGAAHRRFHPRAADPGRDAERRVGPLPIGGSGSTPMAMGVGSDFQLVSGASVRVVLDVGAWDNSVAINTPASPAIRPARIIATCSRAGPPAIMCPSRGPRPRVLQEAERIIRVTPVP
jgi:penicillin G amidase